MNSLRIRAIKLDPLGAPDHADYPFAVVVSQDGLMWWPVARYKTVDEVLDSAKGFEKFTKVNTLLKASHVLWAGKIA